MNAPLGMQGRLGAPPEAQLSRIAALAVAFAADWGLEVMVPWVLPLATVLQGLPRLRAILEHGAVRSRSSTLLTARTEPAPHWMS